MNNILYIKTDKKDSFFLGLFKNKKYFEKNIKTQIGKMSQILLKEILIFLKKYYLKLNNIDVIIVYQGPGSYTSLRVGILTANTIAYSLDKPIYTIKNNQKIEAFINKKNNFKKNKRSFNKPVNAYYQQV